MQPHSGSDWVGMLRHTEEMECVGTGRDRQRQNSSAEWGKMEEKPHLWVGVEGCGGGPRSLPRVQLHIKSIFRLSLSKIWTSTLAFVTLPGSLAGPFGYLTTIKYKNRKKTVTLAFFFLNIKRGWCSVGELVEPCVQACVCACTWKLLKLFPILQREVYRVTNSSKVQISLLSVGVDSKLYSRAIFVNWRQHC